MTKRNFTMKVKKTAVSFQVGGFRPDDRIISSWFGKVLVCSAGESWPESNGNPMTPVCQLNLTEIPFRPENLKDIQFITLFIDRNTLPDDGPNGENWLIRTYASIEELVSINPPDVKFQIKPFQLKPEIIENDFPCMEDCPEEIPEKFEDEYQDLFPNKDGIKIGGWPTLVQSEIFWIGDDQHRAKPEYVFQIDSIEKAGWQWGDNGVAYVGRGTIPGSRNQWFFSWQSY